MHFQQMEVSEPSQGQPCHTRNEENQEGQEWLDADPEGARLAVQTTVLYSTAIYYVNII